MRKTKLPSFKKLLSTYTVSSLLLLFLLLSPAFIFGQCPPGVTNFPDDVTINDNDECTSLVTWVEPTYSLDCDDFDESFDPSNWTLNANGQNGSVNTAGAPSAIAITGSSNGTPGTDTDTDYCITIPFDGMINFDWTANAIGGGAQLINDEPAYTINGTETQLNVNGVPVGMGVSSESGIVANLAVTAGQVFCFRVKSNNQGATTTMDIDNFSFEITQIVQTSGVPNNSVQSIGDYIIEYTVPLCNGNTASCDFTVTVSEDIPPMITCPADITMNNDTDRCSAVVCYNVEVTDNCDAILPTDIDEFNFLGTFGGHNYFVSEPSNTLLWEEANEEASALGGHLVVVTSDAEQNFLIANVPNGTYWIGLRYSPSLEEFKWVNGEPFDYDSWGPGQPGFIEGDYVFNWDFFGTFLDGWYDVPSILPIRYIIEIETYQTELTAGLPAGSIFPVGITEVTYVATDASGNTDDCSFNVTVLDVQAPEIECPSDTIIQLMEEQCDTLVTFEDPMFSDNCPDAVITQIEGLPSGSLFPIGVNVVSFEARDTSGNADTCTWNIIVNEFIPNGLLCKGVVNFSIDSSTCSGTLLPSMLIDVTSVGCADSCTITIKDSNGIKKPAVFSTDDIGKSYEYEICCGGICCWGVVNVEYKLDPIIDCVETDTLSCTQAFDEAMMPSVSSNCAPTELVLLSETFDQLSCDTMFTGQMIRKWVAKDIYGNTSDTCTQTIFMRRTNLDSISPVQPFAIFNGKALSCSSGFATTSKGYPFPALSVTGSPMLKVKDGSFINLFPFEAKLICNGYAEFTDEILLGSTSCVTKIMRTFVIGEWWCSSTNQRTFTQLIEVVDFDGPSITCPADRTISTSGHTCEGTIVVKLPVVSDACNGENIKIDLGTPVGFYENYSGQPITLPAGVHTLTYTAYDKCGNHNQCTFEVTVRDEADPIAICDQFTTISIGLEDITYITAMAIDDGSFDECGDVVLEVARMDDPGFNDFSAFAPKAPIYCSDAGSTIMVGLLVTDAGGNTNMCMVSVEVQDKVDAKMTCPEDVSVPCDFPYDPNQLSDFFGPVVIFDNCPDANTIREKLIGELNSCGSGELIREISLINAQGNQVDFCTQQITFESGETLHYSDITPPPAEVTVTGCGIESIDPEILGMPIVPDRECQLAGISISNDTFPFTQNGACLKILRTFKVIDWCISTGPGSVLNPFVFTQTIKVNNLVGPIFSNVFVDSMFCSYSVGCGPITINGYLTAQASDDCTAANDLNNRFEVRNEANALVNYGFGLDASGTYDLGSYEVSFISEDKCGNQTLRKSTFSVRNCKLPTPYCLQGLSTTLVPMDTTGDGTADIEMVMININFFDAGSYHPCGYDVSLSFSADLSDTVRAYFCKDTVGLQPVELWVTDNFLGNSDYCTTYIDIQDNDTIDLCGDILPGKIQGRIYTDVDAELKDVEVELRSSESIWSMTDENGVFGFFDMPMGGTYEVKPVKNNDFMNGVSTLDLVMIQRHILGITPLSSVYKQIAADVNNDQKISSSDLLALRKMILGISQTFPNNTSWRFIDEAFIFPNPNDPWESEIAEAYGIFDFSSDMWIDFIAVKTGDVNGNVDMNLKAGVISETRSAKSMTLELPNLEVENGKLYKVDVRSSDQLTVFGMQFTLDMYGIELVDIIPGRMDMNQRYTSSQDDRLHVSYVASNVDGDQLVKSDLLYTLVLKAKTSGALAEMISISTNGLETEVYLDEQLEIASMDIEWRDSENASLVESMELIGNNPNPWNNSTLIAFKLPSDGEVLLNVSDVNGKLLFSKRQSFESGAQHFNLSNNDAKFTGLLFYELRFEDQILNGKMIKIE